MYKLQLKSAVLNSVARYYHLGGFVLHHFLGPFPDKNPFRAGQDDAQAPAGDSNVRPGRISAGTVTAIPQLTLDAGLEHAY